MNLEVSTGKVISTKDNINIRCRINSSEDHSWHTSHSQLNLIVDLLHNLYITWGKRQDELDIIFERLYKEHKQLEEQYFVIHNKINLALQVLEENKTEQSKVCQNSDYIKKDITLLYKKLDLLSNPDKIPETKEIAEVSTKIDQDIVKIKKLVEEVKTLVLS